MIKLSEREITVINGIKAGKTLGEVSEQLKMVKPNVAKIYLRLKAKGVIEHISVGHYRVVTDQYETKQFKPEDESKEQLAMEAFQHHELDLFFKLKRAQQINTEYLEDILEAICSNGVSKRQAKKFLNAQIRDMKDQIKEQEAVAV